MRKEWEGREGRSWRHGFWGGGDRNLAPRSFLKVGAYAPHSQQSSSDKCKKLEFRNGQKV